MKEDRITILGKLQNNYNAYTQKDINDYIKSGDITEQDLKDIGIPDDILFRLFNYQVPKLDYGNVPEFVANGYTEVYFWGDTGSGKTCALAGILGFIDNEGSFTPEEGDGYLYMTQLKNVFRGKIGVLPGATNVEVTQYLPFKLSDKKNKQHPIALIELSGEIFKCFFETMAGRQLGKTETQTFETLKNYLNGPNKKIHFFIVDISADPIKLDTNGICLADYLNAAQLYFTANDIFKNATEAIYIVATKSDTLNCPVEERGELARSFLLENYKAFINMLKTACKKYEINDDNDLHVIPFSLGIVFFNKICEFNPHSSEEIATILKQKTNAEVSMGFFRRKMNS